MSICDATCKPCIYSSVMSTWGVSCNYILVTGNRRGCPAGKGCERRIVGKKQYSIDGLIFRGTKKEPPKKKKNSREQKRLYRERTQALYKGRQHDAIKEFCERTGWSYTQIAKALGVSQTTVAYWAKEYSPANWKLLAKLGIEEVRV